MITLLGLLGATLVGGFGQPSSLVGRTGSPRVAASLVLRSSPNEDFPPPRDEEVSVDWDAEWKKVVANQDQPKQRPGKDFYKSDAEIAVTTTINRSIETVQKQAAKIDIPSINTATLTSDWRFWIAVLAVVSVVTAVMSAPPQMPMEETYYI
jgi:hypothetical protein